MRIYTLLQRMILPMLFSLIMWVILEAGAFATGGPLYDVVITQTMYVPEVPFHVTDIRYVLSDFETRTLIIAQPYQNGQLLRHRPVIFFVHGGGWVDGYASWYTDILTPTFTATQGWVVVNVDYRLTSDQVFLADDYCRTSDTCDLAQATKAAWYDDNLRDVAAAFEWTVQNISAYGGDPDNIFLFGHSAGGHLVSLVATHEGYRDIQQHMRGIISMSGAYDLNDLDVLFYPVLDQTFRGGHQDRDALEEASPETYVRPGESVPPFYVLHCQYDIPSLPEQAISFRNKLETFGYSVEWDYLLGYTHTSEMAAVADPQEDVSQRIVNYVQNHIKRKEHHTAFLPFVAYGSSLRE